MIWDLNFQVRDFWVVWGFDDQFRGSSCRDLRLRAEKEDMTRYDYEVNGCFISVKYM